MQEHQHVPSDNQPIKLFFYHFLENPDSRRRDLFNVAMMGVVMFSLATMVLETNPDLTPEEVERFHHLDFGYSLLFLVEYLLRFWVCSDFVQDYRQAFVRRRRRHHRDNETWVRLQATWDAVRPKLLWMRRPMSVVDLLSILPLFGPFRLLRVLRVLRILKLFRYSRRLSFFTVILADRRQELISLSVVMVLVVSMVALAFYIAEHPFNESVHHFWQALYWSVITVTTVGYGDITPVTPLGQGVAMVGVIMGMSVPVFMTSILVTALTERILLLKEQRMERVIERLRGHIIVCGLDPLGWAVCQTLKLEGRKFACIDERQERVEAAMREGWAAIHGDVTQEEAWERLGLGRASCVISAIGDEATNVYLILIVREHRPDCFVVACGISPDSEKRLLKVGANRVISPFRTGGAQMAYTALRPKALHFLDLVLKRDLVELEMEELIIPPGSVMAGKPLSESNLRRDFDIIVVGIVPADGELIFNPKADTLLNTGDCLICLGHQDDLDRLMSMLSGRRF
ncbi:MAG: NAD-binding protein [Magnetococcales bacterium]|nr:NAD-binding protein [Magnetococcales bacterium]